MKYNWDKWDWVWERHPRNAVMMGQLKLGGRSIPQGIIIKPSRHIPWFIPWGWIVFPDKMGFLCLQRGQCVVRYPSWNQLLCIVSSGKIKIASVYVLWNCTELTWIQQYTPHQKQRKKRNRHRNTLKSVSDALPHPIQWTREGKSESALPSGLNTWSHVHGSMLWPTCGLLKGSFVLCANIRT